MGGPGGSGGEFEERCSLIGSVCFEHGIEDTRKDKSLMSNFDTRRECYLVMTAVSSDRSFIQSSHVVFVLPTF